MTAMGSVLRIADTSIQIAVLTLVFFVFIIFLAGVIWLGLSPDTVEKFKTTEIVGKSDTCGSSEYKTPTTSGEAGSKVTPISNALHATSLTTDMLHENHKCKNGAEPTKLYNPKNVPKTLLGNMNVYVNTTANGWRPAYVNKMDSSSGERTASVVYTDTLSREIEENIPLIRIKRTPTGNEIEACADACGLKGKLSVGNCPPGGGKCSCKCGVSTIYAECNPIKDMIWNTYAVNCKMAALKPPGTDEAPQPVEDDDGVKCPPEADTCKSQCDNLEDPEARKLCKNPGLLAVRNASVPKPRRISSTALCDLDLTKLTRAALKCPAREAEPKPCWQRRTQAICQESNKCQWRAGMCTKKSVVTANVCKNFPTIKYLGDDEADYEIPRLFSTNQPDIDKLVAVGAPLESDVTQPPSNNSEAAMYAAIGSASDEIISNASKAVF